MIQPSVIFILLYMSSSCEIMDMHLGFMAIVPAQGALLLIHIKLLVCIMFISRLHRIKCLLLIFFFSSSFFLELLPADTEIVLMSVKPSFKCG